VLFRAFDSWSRSDVALTGNAKLSAEWVHLGQQEADHLGVLAASRYVEWCAAGLILDLRLGALAEQKPALSRKPFTHQSN
jgi:hypothetical protein